MLLLLLLLGRRNFPTQIFLSSTFSTTTLFPRALEPGFHCCTVLFSMGTFPAFPWVARLRYTLFSSARCDFPTEHRDQREHDGPTWRIFLISSMMTLCTLARTHTHTLTFFAHLNYRSLLSSLYGVTLSLSFQLPCRLHRFSPTG